MERTIGELDLAVQNLRAPLAKAQTRLRGRTERPCPELTNDRAQRQLVREVRQIQSSGDRLRRELASAQAQLRSVGSGGSERQARREGRWSAGLLLLMIVTA